MTYDAIVIGAGPAGYVCAIRLAQLGQKAAVVEKGAIGGVCLNVGCIPSKALIAASKLVDRIQSAETMGITAKDVQVDIDKLVAWKEGIVGKLTGGVGTLLKNHKVDVHRGTARILGRDILEAPAEIRASIGYMPENDAFIAGMSAVRLTRLMAEVSGLPARLALERAHEALFYVGLGEARYRNVDEYSQGMKQRAKLAQLSELSCVARRAMFKNSLARFEG